MIPLDYDMDGDGYISREYLIDPTSTLYVERLVTPVSNDPYLKRYADGSPIPEYDTDNGGDNDMDGDGREDIYSSSGEDSVYDNDWDNDGMDQAYETDYGVIHNGWQNPYIFNARYAVLIGGGSTDSSKNYPAFKNDLKAMYDKLKGYNYLDENIYCFLWDKKDSYADWVDGPAVWDHTTPVDNYFPGELLIENGFKRIGENITVNDFFFFVEICHGSGIPNNTDPDNAVFDICNVHDSNVSDQHFLFGPEEGYGFPNLKEKLDLNIKKYARAIFILQSCEASAGIHLLAGENRIVITPENYEVDEWREVGGKEGNTFTEIDHMQHWAFIWEGHHKWWSGEKYIPGFIKTVGSISNPESVLHAFNNGYKSASNNWYDTWPWITDGRSHPMLEDYADNGINGKQGMLSPSSASEEGWLADHTHL